MKYDILLTDDASNDLEDIIDYISTYDSPQNADYVLNQLEEQILNLEELPDRGSHPKELSSLGIKEYREVYYKPYRIIYRVFADKLYVYLIADGRRDMRTLLEKRLLSL